jgi:inorganic pyrophosphatase
MTFPYDFGFLPQTLAPDGDPIDVLLLMDEPAFSGCAVPAKLIGVIEGEQIDRKRGFGMIDSSQWQKQTTCMQTSRS